MNRATRTYDVGDRVTIVGGPKLRADTGVVVEVKQDPLPYRVDFGAPWTPAWWSGIDLEPASEIFAVDPVREYERRAEVDAADSAPTCRAPFCGSWTAVMRYRVFGVSGIVVCMRPECGAWGELRSDELLDGYDWREHAARMRRGDCQPRHEARKVDGEFSSVAEHIAAWKAGGRRWAKVEGFNVDAWQAERDALARADAVATVMAADPVMAARCGVPAVIGEATACEDLAAACATVEASRASGLAEALKPAVMAYTATEHPAAKRVEFHQAVCAVRCRCGVPVEVPRDDWGPLPDDLVAAIAAAHIASMPASTGGEACPTCGAVKGER